jgi:hypothetical protein
MTGHLEVTPMTTTKEIVLDDRRRTSLARIGHRDHARYLVEEFEDGTIMLRPAVTISQTELNLLRNPDVRAALEAANRVPTSAGRRRPEYPAPEAAEPTPLPAGSAPIYAEFAKDTAKKR